MARITEQEEAVNADSFLDIVASVVSVMIIMVMMTGLKIKNTPPEAQPTSEVARAGGDLVQKQQRRADAPRRRGESRRGDGTGSSPDGHAAARTRYPGPGHDRARSAVARRPADGGAAIAARRSVGRQSDRRPQPAGDSQPPAGSDREVSRAVGARSRVSPRRWAARSTAARCTFSSAMGGSLTCR